MELYILSKEEINVIDCMESLIWIRRYSQSGEFTLQVNFTEEMNRILQIKSLVYKQGDREVGNIISKNRSIGDDGKETITVTGNFLTIVLKQRIVWNTIMWNGTIENLMREAVNRNCVNCESKRKIPNLSVAPAKGYSETIEKQISYENLYETIAGISEEHDIGYRITFDFETSGMEFETYKGTDRTVHQDALPPCIFSRDFENVLSIEQLESITDIATTALIGGEGEGTERIMASAGEDIEGLERYEIFTDASSNRKTYTEDGEEITISDAEYNNILKQAGMDDICEYMPTNTIEAKFNESGNMTYRKDYDLGDCVTLIDKKWGIAMDARITEIEEVYEDSATEINITFGKQQITLIKKLKRGIR